MDCDIIQVQYKRNLGKGQRCHCHILLPLPFVSMTLTYLQWSWVFVHPDNPGLENTPDSPVSSHITFSLMHLEIYTTTKKHLKIFGVCRPTSHPEILLVCQHQHICEWLPKHHREMPRHPAVKFDNWQKRSWNYFLEGRYLCCWPFCLLAAVLNKPQMKLGDVHKNSIEPRL